jgi:hypothetical protein
MIIIKKIPKISCESIREQKKIEGDVKTDLSKIENKLHKRFELVKKYGSSKEIKAFITQLKKTKRYIRKRKKEIIEVCNRNGNKICFKKT